MIHVIDFFELSNTRIMSIVLAIAFEIGAAASLASIIVMHRMKRGIVWALFILLTMMQIMGNMYNSYANLSNFQQWIELFGLTDKPIIFQKRILAIISGLPLPLIALGFIKALVDYIRPPQLKKEFENNDTEDNIIDDYIDYDQLKKEVEEEIQPEVNENYIDKNDNFKKNHEDKDVYNEKNKEEEYDKIMKPQKPNNTNTLNEKRSLADLYNDFRKNK
jgi:hypothetical protein